MHTVQSFSFKVACLLPLLVFVPQVQQGCIHGGAALAISVDQHVEIGLTKGDHRNRVDQHPMTLSPVTALKNEPNPTSAALVAPHHIAKAGSAPSFNVDSQLPNHPTVHAMARMSTAFDVPEVNSTANPRQTSSTRGRSARRFITQHTESTLKSVMRSENSRKVNGVALGSMAQRRDSKLQSLMRSQNSKRGKGILESKTISSPMQVFSDGHMSLFPVEKARGATDFDIHPPDNIGEQAFIVDQSGHASPDLEIAPRRNEHVLSKGAARGSVAQRKDAKLQGLMRSENSKRGKGALEHKTISSPMQAFNGGNMSLLPAERPHATSGFDSHPSGSTWKQASVVDQSGHAAPGLVIAPTFDEHGIGKGVALGAVTQRKDSNLQSLMRSESSKRGRGVRERGNPVSPMQAFNDFHDGHRMFHPVGKARASTGLDNHPPDTTGKQAFIVDQSGHASPDLEIAPRRNEHVLSKGVARGSVAQRKDAKLQGLMRSENSKRGRGAMQVFNDGHMSLSLPEKARASTNFKNPPPGNTGKQTSIAKESDHAASHLEITQRPVEHDLFKTKNGLTEQKVAASQDRDAERASAVPPSAENSASTGSGGNHSVISAIIVVALLVLNLVLLDRVLNNRIRSQQEDAEARSVTRTHSENWWNQQPTNTDVNLLRLPSSSPRKGSRSSSKRSSSLQDSDSRSRERSQISTRTERSTSLRSPVFPPIQSESLVASPTRS